MVMRVRKLLWIVLVFMLVPALIPLPPAHASTPTVVGYVSYVGNPYTSGVKMTDYLITNNGVYLVYNTNYGALIVYPNMSVINITVPISFISTVTTSSSQVIITSRSSIAPGVVTTILSPADVALFTYNGTPYALVVAYSTYLNVTLFNLKTRTPVLTTEVPVFFTNATYYVYLGGNMLNVAFGSSTYQGTLIINMDTLNTTFYDAAVAYNGKYYYVCNGTTVNVFDNNWNHLWSFSVTNTSALATKVYYAHPSSQPGGIVIMDSYEDSSGNWYFGLMEYNVTTNTVEQIYVPQYIPVIVKYVDGIIRLDGLPYFGPGSVMLYVENGVASIPQLLYLINSYATYGVWNTTHLIFMSLYGYQYIVPTSRETGAYIGNGYIIKYAKAPTIPTAPTTSIIVSNTTTTALEPPINSTTAATPPSYNITSLSATATDFTDVSDIYSMRFIVKNIVGNTIDISPIIANVTVGIYNTTAASLISTCNITNDCIISVPTVPDASVFPTTIPNYTLVSFYRLGNEYYLLEYDAPYIINTTYPIMVTDGFLGSVTYYPDKIVLRGLAMKTAIESAIFGVKLPPKKSVSSVTINSVPVKYAIVNGYVTFDPSPLQPVNYTIIISFTPQSVNTGKTVYGGTADYTLYPLTLVALIVASAIIAIAVVLLKRSR